MSENETKVEDLPAWDFDEWLKEESKKDITWDIRWRRFKNSLSNLYYEIRGLILPHNVLKIHNCPRTWNDRDYRLFHAMFQILVDFIELEQPYLDWGKQEDGRCLDVEKQETGMEHRYNPIHQIPDEWDPGLAYYEKAYAAHRVIFDLYKWYKDREWDKEFITDWDAEKAHIALCDEKLHEIVRLRHHFWT